MKFWVRVTTDSSYEEQLLVSASSCAELKAEISQLLKINIFSMSITDFNTQVAQKLKEGVDLIIMHVETSAPLKSTSSFTSSTPAHSVEGYGGEVSKAVRKKGSEERSANPEPQPDSAALLDAPQHKALNSRSSSRGSADFSDVDSSGRSSRRSERPPVHRFVRSDVREEPQRGKIHQMSPLATPQPIQPAAKKNGSLGTRDDTSGSEPPDEVFAALSFSRDDMLTTPQPNLRSPLAAEHVHSRHGSHLSAASHAPSALSNDSQPPTLIFPLRTVSTFSGGESVSPSLTDDMQAAVDPISKRHGKLSTQSAKVPLSHRRQRAMSATVAKKLSPIAKHLHSDHLRRHRSPPHVPFHPNSGGSTPLWTSLVGISPGSSVTERQLRGCGRDGSSEVGASNATPLESSFQVLDATPRKHSEFDPEEVRRICLTRIDLELLLDPKVSDATRNVAVGCLVRVRAGNGFEAYQVTGLHQPNATVGLDLIIYEESRPLSVVSTVLPTVSEIRQWAHDMLVAERPVVLMGFVEAKAGDVESALRVARTVNTIPPEALSSPNTPVDEYQPSDATEDSKGVVKDKKGEAAHDADSHELSMGDGPVSVTKCEEDAAQDRNSRHGSLSKKTGTKRRKLRSASSSFTNLETSESPKAVSPESNEGEIVQEKGIIRRRAHRSSIKHSQKNESPPVQSVSPSATGEEEPTNASVKRHARPNSRLSSDTSGGTWTVDTTAKGLAFLNSSMGAAPADDANESAMATVALLENSVTGTAILTPGRIRRRTNLSQNLTTLPCNNSVAENPHAQPPSKLTTSGVQRDPSDDLLCSQSASLAKNPSSSFTSDPGVRQNTGAFVESHTRPVVRASQCASSVPSTRPSPEKASKKNPSPSFQRRNMDLKPLRRVGNVPCGRWLVKGNDVVLFPRLCLTATTHGENAVTVSLTGTRMSNREARKKRRGDFAGCLMILHDEDAHRGVVSDRDITEKGYELLCLPQQWKALYFALATDRPSAAERPHCDEAGNCWQEYVVLSGHTFTALHHPPQRTRLPVPPWAISEGNRHLCSISQPQLCPLGDTMHVFYLVRYEVWENTTVHSNEHDGRSTPAKSLYPGNSVTLSSADTTEMNRGRSSVVYGLAHASTQDADLESWTLHTLDIPFRNVVYSSPDHEDPPLFSVGKARFPRHASNRASASVTPHKVSFHMSDAASEGVRPEWMQFTSPDMSVENITVTAPTHALSVPESPQHAPHLWSETHMARARMQSHLSVEQLGQDYSHEHVLVVLWFPRSVCADLAKGDDEPDPLVKSAKCLFTPQATDETKGTRAAFSGRSSAFPSHEEDETRSGDAESVTEEDVDSQVVSLDVECVLGIEKRGSIVSGHLQAPPAAHKPQSDPTKNESSQGQQASSADDSDDSPLTSASDSAYDDMSENGESSTHRTVATRTNRTGDPSPPPVSGTHQGTPSRRSTKQIECSGSDSSDSSLVWRKSAVNVDCRYGKMCKEVLSTAVSLSLLQHSDCSFLGIVSQDAKQRSAVTLIPLYNGGRP